MNTEDLRRSVADFEAALEAATHRVLDAEHAHTLAVRSHVTRSLSGDYCTKAVTAASSKLREFQAECERAQTSLDAARKMLAEHLAAEEQARLATARAELGGMADEITAAAAEFDTAAAIFVGRYTRLRRLETKANAFAREHLGQDPGWPITKDVLPPVVSVLRSLENECPQELPAVATMLAAKVGSRLRSL